MGNALLVVAVTDIFGQRQIRRFSLVGQRQDRANEVPALDALLHGAKPAVLDIAMQDDGEPGSIRPSLIQTAKIANDTPTKCGTINGQKVAKDDILVVSAIRNMVIDALNAGHNVKITVQVF